MTRCRHCGEPLNLDAETVVHASGERACSLSPWGSYVATLNRPRVVSYAGEA